MPLRSYGMLATRLWNADNISAAAILILPGSMLIEAARIGRTFSIRNGTPALQRTPSRVCGRCRGGLSSDRIFPTAFGTANIARWGVGARCVRQVRFQMAAALTVVPVYARPQSGALRPRRRIQLPL